MENEILNIFDEDRNHIGVATREEVHRLGHWHETFHCWFGSKENGVYYLFLQLRSELKKDYPNLLDITAAGHLLAHETVHDGVREVEEEIGVAVSFMDLVPLGVIDYCVKQEGFIDKELANVFLYDCQNTLEQFTLQKEEVSGIVKVVFDDFYELWLGDEEEIRIQGFGIAKDGERISINKLVGRDGFVPHGKLVYEEILNLIKGKIK
nr:NUDIX hydrolase [Sporosarcina limicola]